MLRNVQGQTLQVKEERNGVMVTITTSERNVQWTEITCERNRGKTLQVRG